MPTPTLSYWCFQPGLAMKCDLMLLDSVWPLSAACQLHVSCMGLHDAVCAPACAAQS